MAVYHQSEKKEKESGDRGGKKENKIEYCRYNLNTRMMPVNYQSDEKEKETGGRSSKKESKIEYYGCYPNTYTIPMYHQSYVAYSQNYSDHDYTMKYSYSPSGCEPSYDYHAMFTASNPKPRFKQQKLTKIEIGPNFHSLLLRNNTPALGLSRFWSLSPKTFHSRRSQAAARRRVVGGLASSVVSLLGYVFTDPSSQRAEGTLLLLLPSSQLAEVTNKEWMNERNRISEVYRQGVEDFIKFAVANDVEKLSTIICPCVKCRNKLRFPIVEVQNHLIINGINRTYTKWLLHGEMSSSTPIAQHPSIDHVELEGNIGEEDIGDIGVEMGNLVDACYGVQDEANVDGEVGQTGAFEERDVPNAKQMKEFKDIPSNKRYIEGSITESYIVAESVRYCMEYMPNSLEGNHKRTHEAFLEEDGEFSDTGPLLDDKMAQSIMSSAGSKQPSLSSPTPSSQSSKTGKEKGKLPIIIGPSGCVVGSNSRKWSNRCGDFVRSCVPVKYSDWRQVPQNFKDDVWRNLMDEFEIDIPEEVARPMLEKGWSQKFRTYKVTLRKSLESEKEEAPRGMDPNHWKEFSENESNPKKKEQKIKNAENRAQLQYSHCLGRYSYAQKTHELQEAEPEKSIDRVDAWFAGHQKEDGTVLVSAKPFYDKLKEANTKRKSGDEGSSTTIENDGLTQVFGKDHRGRLRGVGSHISKKQMVIVEIGKAKESAKKKEKAKGDALKDEMMASVQSQIQTMHADLKNDLMLSMQSLLNYFMNNAKESSPPMRVTPRTRIKDGTNGFTANDSYNRFKSQRSFVTACNSCLGKSYVWSLMTQSQIVVSRVVTSSPLHQLHPLLHLLRLLHPLLNRRNNKASIHRHQQLVNPRHRPDPGFCKIPRAGCPLSGSEILLAVDMYGLDRDFYEARKMRYSQTLSAWFFVKQRNQDDNKNASFCGTRMTNAREFIQSRQYVFTRKRTKEVV
ncbi:hypothetical protein LguiB_021420 [Lonicera macranthoides]